MASYDVIELMCIAAWQKLRTLYGNSQGPWVRASSATQTIVRAAITDAIDMGYKAGEIVTVYSGKGIFYIAPDNIGPGKWQYHDGEHWVTNPHWHSPEQAFDDAFTKYVEQGLITFKDTKKP